MARENGVVDFADDFLPYFRERYGGLFPPEKYDDAVVAGYFDFAAYGKIIDNSPQSVVRFGPGDGPEDGQRLYLYGLIVAHLCHLDGRGPGMTGQLVSGTQGSVSATLRPLALGGDFANYWAQSQWGARYWMATRYLRSMRYAPPLRPTWK